MRSTSATRARDPTQPHRLRRLGGQSYIRRTEHGDDGGKTIVDLSLGGATAARPDQLTGGAGGACAPTKGG
ncbi:hypothetical protein GCM10009733_085780 [Nonomuraea maheshkhaliensis]|uniref:Uncharacterized protein n=1 Tax=Nonomuraea maheshkhaliensis TaxID=419590 RepID=A0ABP4SN40_9ACTN